MAKETGEQKETGKQRKSRIELGYYKVPDAQSRWRFWLSLLALVAAGGWILIAPIWSPGRPRDVRLFQQNLLASKGPLAQPHATWDSTCEACHVPFTPINGSHWAPKLGSGTQAGDGNCRTCHRGPEHHKSQRSEDVPSCAECHRDHRGRDASLLAMDDAVCTTCHKDLAKHRATGFDADPEHHPPFTPPEVATGTDEVRIKFNHARHLAKGLTLDTKGIPLKTFANLDPADRSRYGWTPALSLETPIQLECASCHQLDSEEYAQGLERRLAGLVPPRAPGAAMLPISYENHCRACHPLHFEKNVPGRQVRHGLEPRALVDELRQFYAADAVKDDPVMLRRVVPSRPIPGAPVPREVARVQKAVADKTLAALKLLFDPAVAAVIRGPDRKPGQPPGEVGGCGECHQLKSSARPLVDLDAASRLEVRPVVVRSLWLESAVFNHATHRALECGHCHKGVRESTDQTKLLLPGIAQCVDCHAPAGTRDGGGPLGGAGVACVECHRYHNGDHTRQGMGAASRRGMAELSLEKFLEGGAASRSR